MFCDFSEVETGDTLLFCSDSQEGVLIRTLTRSNVNHSGTAVFIDIETNMVLSGSTIGTEKERQVRLFVLESSTGNMYDFETTRIVKGVRLIPIDHLVKDYRLIIVRKMKIDRNEVFMANLNSFIKRYCGSPYERSTLTLAGTLLGYNWDAKDYSYFCSELNALFLYELGFLDSDHREKHPPATFYPAHFSSSYKNSKVPDYLFASDDIIVYSRDMEFPTRIIIIMVAIVIICLIIRKGVLTKHK